jgi:hypothetical protein
MIIRFPFISCGQCNKNKGIIIPTHYYVFHVVGIDTTAAADDTSTIPPTAEDCQDAATNGSTNITLPNTLPNSGDTLPNSGETPEDLPISGDGEAEDIPKCTCDIDALRRASKARMDANAPVRHAMIVSLVAVGIIMVIGFIGFVICHCYFDKDKGKVVTTTQVHAH